MTAANAGTIEPVTRAVAGCTTGLQRGVHRRSEGTLYELGIATGTRIASVFQDLVDPGWPAFAPLSRWKRMLSCSVYSVLELLLRPPLLADAKFDHSQLSGAVTARAFVRAKNLELGRRLVRTEFTEIVTNIKGILACRSFQSRGPDLGVRYN